VRPEVPFGFMAGYHALADKTVEAWRNLWFHTGDAGAMDDTGLVTFVDRIKDCIRRRGENISAAEVEAALLQLPGVAEVPPSRCRRAFAAAKTRSCWRRCRCLAPPGRRRSSSIKPTTCCRACKAALCRTRE
jgi:hypothetical protein